MELLEPRPCRPPDCLDSVTILLTLGCASTGPVEMSPGVYMISKADAAEGVHRPRDFVIDF